MRSRKLSFMREPMGGLCIEFGSWTPFSKFLDPLLKHSILKNEHALGVHQG